MGRRGASHPTQRLRGQRWQDKLQELRVALLSWGRGVEGPGVGQLGQSMRCALTDPEGSGKPLACFVHGLGLG